MIYDNFRDKEGKPPRAGRPGQDPHHRKRARRACSITKMERDAEQLRQPTHRRGPRADPRERHGLGRRRLLSGLKLDNDGDLGKVRRVRSTAGPAVHRAVPRLWKAGRTRPPTWPPSSTTSWAWRPTRLTRKSSSRTTSAERRAARTAMMSAGRGSTVLEGAVAVMENFQSARAATSALT